MEVSLREAMTGSPINFHNCEGIKANDDSKVTFISSVPRIPLIIYQL